MGKTMVLNMDNNEMLSIDYQDYIAAVKNKHIKESKLTERFSYDDSYKMLDIAAGYSSTQHQAANQQWREAQDLYDYLKSDHIPRKFHKKFYKSIKSEFPTVKF